MGTKLTTRATTEMDFLGTYLADEHNSEHSEEKPKSKIDVSHYPSPKGLEEFARVREASNSKDPRNRLKPLFLNLPRNNDDEDFDHSAIPTVASDLLTPITTQRGFFHQPLDFCSSSGKTPINAMDSMRTIFLTPRIGAMKKFDIEKKLTASNTQSNIERNETQNENKGEVDSGPMHSMFEYFKSNTNIDN